MSLSPQISLRSLLKGVACLLSATGMSLAASSDLQPPRPSPSGSSSVLHSGAILPKLDDLRAGFESPPAEARPWVFWYWMYGALSREGLTADLEAMKQAGIGGACLMSIKAPEQGPAFEHPAATLSPAWWEMIGHAFSEADRLGIKLSMAVSDGFATAGGPWITPEKSMQRLTWSETLVSNAVKGPIKLPPPPHKDPWYRDLRVLAYPSQGAPFPAPSRVTSSVVEADVSRLFTSADAPVFRSETAAWLQADFAEEQVLRSLTIVQGGGNYQANRLLVEASQDGLVFRRVCLLEAPRHGWSDGDLPTTHSIPATRARHFRFSWDPQGSEPGGEDLDSAKWKPVLKLRGLRLSSAPVLHQFEGKNGSAWRLAASAEQAGLDDASCPPASAVLDLTALLQDDGTLAWEAPVGSWSILRIGTTTTGHVNATAGAGKGLECDKLSADAVRLQFQHWYQRLLETAGPKRTPRVLETLHVDSWECGSQNWSPVLSSEFRRRRGYPLEHYMPVLAGVPLDSVARSEQFLHDYRRTIAELVNENFFGTLATLVRAKGLKFSAECTAPVMGAEGLSHYSLVDIPMGEFWLRSPSHDKPNDISDAVSGAHIYGKPLVQAEAFTELRMSWDEHPGMLKALGDLHFARGVNRFMLHVFTHNPWLDRRPGMTLDPIGVYFQRDQTWWPFATAWTSYLSRAQFLLQQGRPVVDIAVFTGEELPSRSLLPDRLIPLLPGLFSPDELAREKARQANLGLPRRTLPAGVTASANLVDSGTWIAPLRGYAYDSINRDALLRLARVEAGRVVLPGGASYSLLVLPSTAALQGRPFTLSLELLEKLQSLTRSGATLLLGDRPARAPGIAASSTAAERWVKLVDELWGPVSLVESEQAAPFRTLGQGRLLQGPWLHSSLDTLPTPPDFLAREAGMEATRLAWFHRELADASLYWISNQDSRQRVLELSLRTHSASAEIWDPASGGRYRAEAFLVQEDRSSLRLRLDAHGSAFVLLRHSAQTALSQSPLPAFPELPTQSFPLTGPWTLAFSARDGGPAAPLHLEQLRSWSLFDDPGVRYYSGTASYSLSFNWSGPLHDTVLDLGEVANLASVELNDIPCGVLWTAPFRLPVSRALRPGPNRLRIQVVNTWANRLIGDHLSPGRPGATWTQAPWLLEGRPLLPAGLLGPVCIRYSTPSLPAALQLAAPGSSSTPVPASKGEASVSSP